MSETTPNVSTPSSATAAGPPAGAAAPTGAGAAPTGWVGWVMFAGCMMILLGAFQFIEGLVALFNQNYYVVGASNLLVSVSYGGWGWAHLIVGVLVALAGFGVLAGQTWARIVGIILAGISAIVNLGFLAAFPVWSVVLIALDIIVIYALSVHGNEVKGLAY